MKLLLFYAHAFSFRTASPGLPDLPELEMESSVRHAAVVFVQVEAEDQEKRAKVLLKCIKNIKWLCGKFDTRNVVLHSFNHLSSSKAPADFSRSLLGDAAERLELADYRVMTTPFGYFNEFNLHVAGDSLAKVFKEF